jgi:hypothetical protein
MNLKSVSMHSLMVRKVRGWRKASLHFPFPGHASQQFIWSAILTQVPCDSLDVDCLLSLMYERLGPQLIVLLRSDETCKRWGLVEGSYVVREYILEGDIGTPASSPVIASWQSGGQGSAFSTTCSLSWCSVSPQPRNNRVSWLGTEGSETMSQNKSFHFQYFVPATKSD